MGPIGESISDVVKPIGEATQEFVDPLKTAITAGRDGQRYDPLTTLFNETIANQQGGVPGGDLPVPESRDFRNYLDQDSMLLAETITVGNMPYKYDRKTKTAYRMDGQPITATEQASVDEILSSNNPVGFGTFSSDSPTPVEMLNAPIDASNQARLEKIRKQKEFVSNMDPAKTTFAEREIERKRLEKLNEIPIANK